MKKIFTYLLYYPGTIMKIGCYCEGHFWIFLQNYRLRYPDVVLDIVTWMSNRHFKFNMPHMELPSSLFYMWSFPSQFLIILFSQSFRSKIMESLLMLFLTLCSNSIHKSTFKIYPETDCSSSHHHLSWMTTLISVPIFAPSLLSTTGISRIFNNLSQIIPLLRPLKPFLSVQRKILGPENDLHILQTLSDLISLPLQLVSSPLPIDVPQQQVRTHLRVFTLAVPSAWNAISHNSTYFLPSFPPCL